MDIINKIAGRKSSPYKEKIPTIVFFGDSVTQGCFEIYLKKDRTIETVYDKKYAYHSYLSEMLSYIFHGASLNIVNAGISGDNTESAIKRIERDVLIHRPDLTVVCFGLNDCVAQGRDYADQYADNLAKIFTMLQQSGSEVIFMTPNMMCTEVSCHITDPYFSSLAADVAKVQNDGVLTEYLKKAQGAAIECGVKVCDVYSKWVRMHECGVDTTELLANSINHPTREMNRLFAWSLVETMFGE